MSQDYCGNSKCVSKVSGKKQYCSEACRQKAFRDRKKAEKALS